ncbi:Hemin transport protein [Pseudoxanthomonas sp. SE1]|uniref:Hemin transport protein n=1 Tax=Pseudoxanthomonas sp. SE1 TaxID=1664560 RepID=UPI00240E53F5|nr:Hemin transport protein [Pseudoxanthomonas sp. SE1]WFC42685.1 Hemin transport protein [Pseudoxanthomonas sp. SE1]
MPTLRALQGSITDASRDAFPMAAQMAALGPVLCLYRTQQGSELAGWQQAVRVQAHAGLDSDGLDERLLFFDAQGRCCWRLCLLPDSDFVAWDRLVASLPLGLGEDVAGLADRLWQRLAGRLLGGQWRACALQLHAVPQPASLPVLAASLSLMSALGVATARRIARAEGAELESGLHDCCCAQSVRPISADARNEKEADDTVVPLVGLQ